MVLTSSSSSSSVSGSESTTTGRVREISETSQDVRSVSQQVVQTTTRSIDQASITGNSPAASNASIIATGTPYDTVSLGASTNTGFNSMTDGRQQSAQSLNVPTLTAPIIPQQQSLLVNTAVPQQQYQQHVLKAEISPSSGSTASSTDRSSLRTTTASLHPQPQQYSQHSTVHTTQQWGQSSAGTAQYQQPMQYISQIPNEFSGFHQDQDSTLNIDYGAIEAYNIAMQSSDNFINPPVPQNMAPGGPRFDIAKAIFNQVDINHDGSISREEFRQWAAGNQSNTVGQNYSQSYSTTTGNNFQSNGSFAGGNADLASILQQSGLGQTWNNYR